MLSKIRFKNFKSFKEETTIDLEATKSEILKDTNTYNGIVKGCAFYGPNASGKTSALDVIQLLLDLLFLDRDINLWSNHCLFSKDQLMSFEYSFLIDKSSIVYSFSIDKNNSVTKESLIIDGKQVLLRVGDGAESSLTVANNFFSDSVVKDKLFLRTIYFNTGFSKFPVLQHWMGFLKRSSYIIAYKGAGNFDTSNNDELHLDSYLEKHGTGDLNCFLKEFDFPFHIDYFPKKNNQLNLPFASRLVFIRNGSEIKTTYQIESFGNKIFLHMLTYFLFASKNGGILAIDEFSSGLHNSLQEMLVKFFYRHSENAQLFFVSHSTNLLKTSILRPDQVFVVDFEENGSVVANVSSFHPRESQNLEKMYLDGVFGAIPTYEGI
jgi:AAA15 family ATPase/GTPase